MDGQELAAVGLRCRFKYELLMNAHSISARTTAATTPFTGVGKGVVVVVVGGGGGRCSRQYQVVLELMVMVSTGING